MENRIFDEKNGLWYEKQGDYYLPCLELPKEKVTEKLKAENAMLWVGKMNEIQARAREIVNAELIYS